MSKKVYFITNTLTGGGAERVMSILSNYLVEKDYEINFILLQSGEIVYDMSDKVKFHIRTNIVQKDMKAQIKFIRSFMKKEPDALFISFFTHQNLFTILASIGTRAKVLVSERNDPGNSFTPKLTKIGNIARNILYKNRHVKKIIFQTQGAADYFCNKIKKKGTVIANPLKDGLPEPYTLERKKTAVAVGRFNPQKNYVLLINAFAEFSKKHPDYKLEIYGDGSLRKSIESYISKLGLEDKIELCGFCKNVHERIIDAGMYVMSSNFEGLSNAMLEALALGLPVISTDHPPGGARAYIKSYENGILTPVGDALEMTKAMCYMAENPEKASEMGMKASQIRDELSTDNICKKWKSVFDGILE
ncbi:MAG: glycosyltransferase [Eubacterium sp.]|nr:glycosyltransferase [Eubacterium sp.]